MGMGMGLGLRKPLQALLVLLALVAIAAPADELYKWVDEDGNVTYQDQPPADAAGEVEALAGNDDDSSRAAALPDVDVVLYSRGACKSCDRVRELLLGHGVPFEEKFIDGDAGLEAELKAIAGVLSVPALLVGDTVLLGHNRDLILARLDEAGFPGVVLGGPALESGAETQGAETPRRQALTREDLEQMSPEEIEQAARDAALRGEDNDLFEEDEGFLTLNKDIFPDPGRRRRADEANMRD